MQDRYAGDVGDFGKLGLLRHLCGVTAQDNHPHMKPGVIWYKTTPGEAEQGKPDGEFVQYLQTASKKPRLYMECDELVFTALARVANKNRTIEALEVEDLLPDAVYCPKDVRHGKKRSTCPRADWFQSAFEETAKCEIVFLDPDNASSAPTCCPLRVNPASMFSAARLANSSSGDRVSSFITTPAGSVERRDSRLSGSSKSWATNSPWHKTPSASCFIAEGPGLS